MATDGKATWWDATSGAPAYLAQELRQIDSLDVMPGPASEPFSGRPGRRVNGKGLEVSVSSSGNGSVTVSPGPCLLYSSAQASQGVWKAQFPQIGPIALGVRPTSGQSRIDLVVARLYDSGAGVGAAKEAKIEVVPGTPNASPSAPSLPAGAVYYELDRLTVPSSGTITHVQTTQRTVSAGGVLPVATTDERNALETAGIAYPGLVVFNAQTGRTETFISTGIWDYPGRWQDYNPGAGNFYATVTGRYCRIGKTIHGRVKATIDAGGAIGTMTMATPSTMATSGGVVGSGLAGKSANTPCVVWASTTASISFYSTINGIEFGASQPGGAWSAGQTLYASFTYEEA